MREILFRGKTLATESKWVEGFYNHIPCGRFMCDEHCIQTINEDGRIGQLYNVYDSTVGQFTGLTDKNGKKIFEGDILRAKVYEMEVVDFPGIGKRKVRTENKIDAVWTVEHKIFNASCGYFVYGKDRRFNRLLTHSVIFNNECEVIGNIHDNPELLEVEDGN